MSQADQVLALLDERGVIRSRDATARGIPAVVLARLVEGGRLERVGRGLYALPSAPLSEEQSLAEASLAVPGGVICLLTALRWHDLTEQNPTSFWVALARGRRAPRRDYPPIEPVWMSEASLRYGVEEIDAEGVTVPITGRAKSVADAYKYRRRLGESVATYALRHYLQRHRGSLDALWEAAEVCRVTAPIRSHVTALLG